MTMTANQHKKSLATCKHLDTLTGSGNSKRRKVKHYHTEQDGKCIWCGKDTWLWWMVTNAEFRKLDRNRLATFEHLIPKSLGGVASKENGACACQECNTLRKNIAFDSFKYVSANTVRYQKWKDIQIAKVVANQKRKDLKKLTMHLNTLRREQEQRDKITTLAAMFEALRIYRQVDFYEQFVYNRTIIKQYGVQYGLF